MTIRRQYGGAAGIPGHVPPAGRQFRGLSGLRHAQVVQNLMQNAIKYGRPGGKLEITIATNGQRVALTVKDNGIGIARHHLPRLTERFYRVSAKESRERGGTGLGLAIVKHIVNRHRGELRIESELGKGSTFTVVLPAAGQSRA